MSPSNVEWNLPEMNGPLDDTINNQLTHGLHSARANDLDGCSGYRGIVYSIILREKIGMSVSMRKEINTLLGNKPNKDNK